jgi:multiple sugar transport system permease protein
MELIMAILNETERSKGKGKIFYWLIEALLCLGVPLQIFPFFWMITNSIKRDLDIIKLPPIFIPDYLHLSGFAEAFTKYNLWRDTYNTAILVVMSLAVQISISALAGYSLSKLRPKYGKFLLLFLMGTMMISSQALMFPLYLMMARFPIGGFSLINNKLSFVLVSSAWAWAVMLFKGFFDNIPSELMESSRIDGANSMQIFFKIILPLSNAVISVVALNTFIAVYNELIMIYLLLPNERHWTLMVRIWQEQGNRISQNHLYVLLTVVVIPILVVYLFAQRKITEGIALTGIKG